MKRFFSAVIAIVILVLGYSGAWASSPYTNSYKMGIKWSSNKATTKITSIDGMTGVSRNRTVEARLVKWNTYLGTITQTYELSSDSDTTTSLSDNLETQTPSNSSSEINRSYHHTHINDGYTTAGATYTMNGQYIVTNYKTVEF